MPIPCKCHKAVRNNYYIQFTINWEEIEKLIKDWDDLYSEGCVPEEFKDDEIKLKDVPTPTEFQKWILKISVV